MSSFNRISAIGTALMVSITSFNGISCLGAVLMLGFATVVDADTASPTSVTIKEVMEAVITPATNTLWQAEDPQTDEEWQLLANAAITTITAGSQVARGGAGSKDAEWASKPEWQAFSKIMINAAEDALKAIRARDIDALFVANDVLYPPCEGCHVAFHPGVQ